MMLGGRFLYVCALGVSVAGCEQVACGVACQIAYESFVRTCDEDCAEDPACLARCRGEASQQRALCDTECTRAPP